MLKEFSYHFITLSTISQQAIIYLFTCVFFMGGWIITSRKSRIKRVTYFVIISLCGLSALVGAFFASNIIQLTISGLAFKLGAFVLLIGCAASFFVGAASVARAQDAFGRRWPAVLGLFPLINLLLVFKRSGDPGQPDHPALPRTLFHGVSGIAVGLSAFVVSVGASAYTELKTSGLPAEMMRDLDTASILFGRLVGDFGTERTVDLIATHSNEALPVQLSNGLLLTRIEADGRLLKHFLVATEQLPELPDMDSIALMRLCKEGSVALYVNLGLSMEMTVSNEEGRIIDILTLSPADCGVREDV